MQLILNHIAKHIALSHEEQAVFLGLLEHRVFPKKSLLLREGDVCRYETFLLKGCVRVYSTDEAGVERVVMLGMEDWWVGDLYSFLSELPSSYAIEALEETEVLQISKANLELLYHEVPQFERFFRIMMQNAFVAQQRRIHQNLAESAEVRYTQFTQRYPQFEQRVPQKWIASYLGITPEFLSMLRRRMVQR